MGTAASNARAIVTWKNSVALHLKRHKKPYVAEHHVEGIATVRFSMDRSGQLLTSQVVHSSGFPLLDKEALEWHGPKRSCGRVHLRSILQ